VREHVDNSRDLIGILNPNLLKYETNSADSVKRCDIFEHLSQQRKVMRLNSIVITRILQYLKDTQVIQKDVAPLGFEGEIA
jgi:hypothetical protein